MSSAALERQLAYVPQVIGRTVAPPVLVCGGMGGSSLPARLLRYLGAYPYLIAHQDYGLPLRMPPDAHYVAVSYSGETEETLSFAEEAIAAGVPLSIVASGGRLLALAERHGLPHVRVPAGEVPRDAVVPMTRALLALIGEDHCFAPSEAAGSASYDADGEALAGTLGGSSVPLFYASTPNEPLAGLAKTLFNETAKVPSFANVFPELDHNELQGFDGHAP
ncbi:MAG TPA: SIS domain-containing protein, partial [Candidatus Paceibacterota bacterium]|nr:SIS domain-containing protein [Candidatus Paceibacterota bacterium]